MVQGVPFDVAHVPGRLDPFRGHHGWPAGGAGREQRPALVPPASALESGRVRTALAHPSGGTSDVQTSSWCRSPRSESGTHSQRPGSPAPEQSGPAATSRDGLASTPPARLPAAGSPSRPPIRASFGPWFRADMDEAGWGTLTRPAAPLPTGWPSSPCTSRMAQPRPRVITGIVPDSTPDYKHPYSQGLMLPNPYTPGQTPRRLAGRKVEQRANRDYLAPVVA